MPEVTAAERFGKVFKVWVPRFPSASLIGWGLHFTKKRGAVEPLVFLRADEWTIADIDGRPPGGAPRGVLAEVLTDRGRQWVYPRPGARSALADPAHRAASLARGAWGMRVESPRSGDPRTLRPGPGVGPGLPGWASFLALASCWEEAGGRVDYGNGPRRTRGVPKSLGRLDERLS